MNDSRMLAVMGNALGVSVADSITSAMHAQHGVTVLVGLERNVRVVDASGRRVEGRVVVVPADHEHAMQSEGPTLGLLYDVEVFHGVDGYAREGARSVDDLFGRRLLSAAGAHRASLGSKDVLVSLGREAAESAAGLRRRIDRRVARVLEALRDPDVEREALRARANVGDAHLQALFARDVGIPIRRYRLWSRLMLACAALRTTDATTAAFVAGFSDLAHLSRTCRRMLGHSPSEMRDAFRATAAP